MESKKITIKKLTIISGFLFARSNGFSLPPVMKQEAQQGSLEYESNWFCLWNPRSDEGSCHASLRKHTSLSDATTGSTARRRAANALRRIRQKCKCANTSSTSKATSAGAGGWRRVRGGRGLPDAFSQKAVNNVTAMLNARSKTCTAATAGLTQSFLRHTNTVHLVLTVSVAPTAGDKNDYVPSFYPGRSWHSHYRFSF